MMKKICLFLTALLLTACANPPQGLEKDEFTLTTTAQIEQDDYNCQCKEVRFGGKVLRATALQHQTKVEIMSMSVSALSAKPVLDGKMHGRFIAYLEGFVDPVSLQDQYITVKGVLFGKEQGKIDQKDYIYPVVKAKAFKQWQLVEEYYYEEDDYPYSLGVRFRGFRGWFAQPKLRYVLR